MNHLFSEIVTLFALGVNYFYLSSNVYALFELVVAQSISYGFKNMSAKAFLF